MKRVKLIDSRLKATLYRLVRTLREGNVLVCPTDTVYGLLADATNEKAVQRIFQIKKRHKGKPLPVFVKDLQMAKRLAKIHKEQEDFLKKAWPGKVTAVLKARHKLPKELEKNGKIALRIPNYDLVNLILKRLNRPLTGTSANISGQPSCSSAAEVIAQFKKRKYQPDVIIDAGKLPESNPSAVIDITTAPYRTIR